MFELALGIAVGAVLGLTGAGGGILAVPALVFGLHWPLAQAAPVALVAVASAAALGAAEGLRYGLVRHRAALFMAAVGMMFAPIGLRMAAVLPERALLLAFAAAMLVVAQSMFRQSATAPSAPSDRVARVDPSTGRLCWTPAVAAALGSIGAASGFLTGLLGVGGGFLIVPALRRFSDIAMQGIVATSLAVIALVSSASVGLAALDEGRIAWTAAVPFAAGALCGMLLGRAGARRMQPSHLQRSFAVVTAVVSAGLLVRAVRVG